MNFAELKARLESLGCHAVRLDEVAGSDIVPYEVTRFDAMPLASPTKTAAGFLRCEGVIATVGVFAEPSDARMQSLGLPKVVRELRLPEEVFSPTSLASYDLAPVTLGHPRSLVTPANAREVTVGSVGRPVVRNDRATAELLITDAKAIAAIESGAARALSCGYTSLVLPVGGQWTAPDGRSIRFDTIQTAIVGNHVAIVREGNAGPGAVIRMDEVEVLVPITHAAAMLQQLAVADSPPRNDKVASRSTAPAAGKKNMKVKIGDIEVEVPDEAGAALLVERNDAVAALAERDRLAGQLAVAVATAVPAAPSADELALTARLVLLARVAPVLKKEPVELVRMDAKTLQVEVLKLRCPGLDVTSKSADFIAGAFENAMAAAAVPAVRLDAATQMRGALGSTGSVVTQPDPIEAARLRMLKAYAGPAVPSFSNADENVSSGKVG